MPYLLQKHYAKGSPDRKALEAALQEAQQKTLEVPTVIDGKEVSILESHSKLEDIQAKTIFYTGQ